LTGRKPGVDEQDRLKRKELHKEVHAMAKRHVTQSRIQMEVLMRPIQALIQRIQREGDRLFAKDRFTNRELFDLVRSATGGFKALVDVERMAMGLHTYSVQVRARSREDEDLIADAISEDPQLAEMATVLLERVSLVNKGDA
jgi:hypothetical protein